ncbi:MAG: hypothetical protein ACD_12C00526G0001 [uncultured bacterium]|nr:MAG: hypothetical protein ACD_12C00526G0001 [uncultured bacterium]
MILVSGILNEALFIAALTLSLASPTALSGRPTMVKPGKPFDATSTSTSIKIPSKPMTVPENILANIIKSSSSLSSFSSSSR